MENGILIELIDLETQQTTKVYFSKKGINFLEKSIELLKKGLRVD